MQFIKLLKLTLIILPLYAPPEPKELFKFSEFLPQGVSQETIKMRFSTPNLLCIAYVHENATKTKIIDITTKIDRAFPPIDQVYENEIFVKCFGTYPVMTHYHPQTDSLFVEQLSSIQRIRVQPKDIVTHIEGYNSIIGMGDDHILLHRNGYNLKTTVLGLLYLKENITVPVKLEKKLVIEPVSFDGTPEKVVDTYAYNPSRKILAYTYTDTDNDTQCYGSISLAEFTPHDFGDDIRITSKFHEITLPEELVRHARVMHKIDFTGNKMITTFTFKKTLIWDIANIKKPQQLACLVHDYPDFPYILKDNRLITANRKAILDLDTQEELTTMPLPLGSLVAKTNHAEVIVTKQKPSFSKPLDYTVWDCGEYL